MQVRKARHLLRGDHGVSHVEPVSSQQVLSESRLAKLAWLQTRCPCGRWSRPWTLSRLLRHPMSLPALSQEACSHQYTESPDKALHATEAPHAHMHHDQLSTQEAPGRQLNLVQVSLILYTKCSGPS